MYFLRPVPRTFVFLFMLLITSTCKDSEDPGIDTEVDPINENNPKCLIKSISIDFTCALGCQLPIKEERQYDDSDRIKSITYLMENRDKNGQVIRTFTFISEYAYDDEGKPISIIGIDNHLLTKDTTYFEYSGNKIEIVSYSSGNRIIKQSIILDSNNKPIQTSTIYQAGVRKYLWLDNNIIGETFDYSNSNGKIETTKEYNNKINPLYDSSLATVDPTSKNLITSYSETHYLNGSEVLYDAVGSYEYSFNDQGLPIEMVYVRSNSGFDITTKYSYEYLCDQ